jgi:EAL domain-containing protein (putative c-di-GMP-specific phosphodiesterase class I)/GGDEF domain-containing protein
VLQGPDAGAARRLSPPALLRLIGERIAEGGHALTALLVARLSPTDRSVLLLGNPAGSALLDEVERRIGAMLRPGDRFAFASREEVWVLLHGLRSEALAQLAAHSLSNRLRRPIALPENELGIAIRELAPAVGVAWLPPGVQVRPQVLVAEACQAADQALDDEDLIRIRRVEITRAGVAPLDLEREIRDVLGENSLEMHFQPQLDLRSGQVDAGEALMRWPADRQVQIDPQTIATVCEARGMIGDLTRFTMNATLRHMAAWRARGLDATIGINLSAAVMSDASTPQTVATALATWGIPAQRVTLELTETALVNDSGTARSVMTRLHELGCRLSIDDFGTGYSPFTYLRSFPLDELKIDQIFTRSLTSAEADRKIVASVIELAHAFGLKIVAEGVSDEDTLAYLRSAGCDLAQGWLLSKAMPADAFVDWCLTYNRSQAG